MNSTVKHRFPDRSSLPVRVRGWFINPYAQILIGALLVTASELMLRRGAVTGGGSSIIGIEALRSGWTWLGIVTYILSMLSWLWVLRHLPLGIAFSLINIVHVLVPLGAWILLDEVISPQRWAGIALVLGGVLTIARDVAVAEERV